MPEHWPMGCDNDTCKFANFQNCLYREGCASLSWQPGCVSDSWHENSHIGPQAAEADGEKTGRTLDIMGGTQQALDQL